MTAVPVTSRQPSPVRSAGSAAARAQPGALLVTGGSRGIGAATARLAAGQGYAVAINYRTTNESAAAVVAALESTGGRAIAVQADVSQEREVARLFEEVDRRLGRLSALVNSAGIDGGPETRVADLEQASLERLLAVNVIGTMLCCRDAARGMATTQGGHPGGAIVQSLLHGGDHWRPAGPRAYAASKGAIDSFTVGFAKEVAREGIRG